MRRRQFRHCTAKVGSTVKSTITQHVVRIRHHYLPPKTSDRWHYQQL
jgi:hypothetical protein